MRRGGELLFTILMVVVAGFVVWQSAGWALRATGAPFAGVFPTGWGSRSGLFPLVIGLPTLVLAVAQLVIDARGTRRPAAAGQIGEIPLDVPPDVVRQRSILILATIFGFVVAIWLLGFLIAIPLVTLLYMKATGESWALAVGLAVATVVIFYFMFVWWLNIPIPPGLLLEPVLG